jgi:hypothetical protein
MSKFFKELAGKRYDALAKAIYDKTTGQVLDGVAEVYMPLMILPRALLSWLVANISKMSVGGNKEFDVPGASGKLKVRKLTQDRYSGELTQDDKIINTFESIPLPAVGAAILHCFELYEDIAGREVSDQEKSDLAVKIQDPKLSDVMEKLGQLLDKITALESKVEAEESDEEKAEQPVTEAKEESSEEGEIRQPTEEMKKAMPKYAIDQRFMGYIRARNRGQDTGGFIPQSNPKKEARQKALSAELERRHPGDTVAQIKAIKQMRRPDPLDQPNRGDYITQRPLVGLEGAVTTSVSGKGLPIPAAKPGMSQMGQDVRTGDIESARARAKAISEVLQAQPKPNLPKSELTKAKSDTFLTEQSKRQIREQRKEQDSGPAGTTERFHPEGKKTPIGKMTRLANLQARRKQKGPNLPKAELEKAKPNVSHETGMKAAPMMPQMPTPPTGPSKGVKTPALNAPKNTAKPNLGSQGPKQKQPKMPQTPKAQKQMKVGVPSVTKEELDAAKSDDGKKVFVKDEGGKYVYNPSGVHSVMQKDSIAIKKNQDGTYNLYVDGQSWDRDNLDLLSKMIKLRHSLKRYGF